MDMTNVRWPQKTRDLHNHHFDSTVWDDFAFRNGDTVVATYAKTGTTWIQQIVVQLLYNGAEGIDISKLCPWMDLRVTPKEERLAMVEAQTHRRVIRVMITDKRKSYGSAKREIMPGVEHRQHKGPRNRRGCPHLRRHHRPGHRCLTNRPNQTRSTRTNSLTVTCEPTYKNTWRFPLWI